MEIYKTQDYTLACKSNGQSCEAVVVEHKGRFFLSHKSFEEIQELKKNDIAYHKTINSNIVMPLVMAIFIAATLIYFFVTHRFFIIDSNYLLANVLLVVNIAIHELGHYVALKLFYRESKIKIGFKFVFVFPAIYVDTSYTYLLPKTKKIAVQLAGCFCNCFFLFVIMLSKSNIITSCYLIVTTILINFIPIVRGDSYHIIMALLNRQSIARSRYIRWLDGFIRGFIMFLLLKGISYISSLYLL